VGWKACKTALKMPGNNLSLLSTCTYIGEFPHITCLSYTDLTCALDRFPSPQYWFWSLHIMAPSWLKKNSLKNRDDQRTRAAELTLRQSIFPIVLVTILFFLWVSESSTCRCNAMEYELDESVALQVWNSANLCIQYHRASPTASSTLSTSTSRTPSTSLAPALQVCKPHTSAPTL